MYLLFYDTEDEEGLFEFGDKDRLLNKAKEYPYWLIYKIKIEVKGEFDETQTY